MVTSSFAAIINADNSVKVYDESVWNPVTWEEATGNDKGQTYRASKASLSEWIPVCVHVSLTYAQTFAERAAWEFVEKEKPNFDVATINPPLVFGPIAHHLSSLSSLNTSNERVRDLIQGKYKDGLPPTGVYLWVDVREVALAHVRAIEVAEAGGKRFFTAAGHFSNKQVADIVRETHPELASKLPENPVDDTPADVYQYNNTLVRQVLGIQFRSLKESVGDTVTSLIKLGALAA